MGIKVGRLKHYGLGSLIIESEFKENFLDSRKRLFGLDLERLFFPMLYLQEVLGNTHQLEGCFREEGEYIRGLAGN